MGLQFKRLFAQPPLFQALTKPRWTRDESVQLFQDPELLDRNGTEIENHRRAILSIILKEDCDSLLAGIMSKVGDFYKDPGEAATKSQFGEVTSIYMLEQYFIKERPLYEKVAGSKRACRQHLSNIIDWICRKKGCTQEDMISDAINTYYKEQK